jgi:hypothetical protein
MIVRGRGRHVVLKIATNFSEESAASSHRVEVKD